jgi:AAA+ superfamily predicted ATPase
MDHDLKTQLSRLIKAYSLRTPQIDDFIKTKGRGIIGLLYGPPGLGKTFTAEAIAEMAKLPLMLVSAGTLGAKSTEIDEKLTKTLELAARWRAVVLLDEADVFLAARDATSIERNAVVSVFLRELEYFPGIMLLTTNQKALIDPAFKSMFLEELPLNSSEYLLIFLQAAFIFVTATLIWIALQGKRFGKSSYLKLHALACESMFLPRDMKIWLR